MGFRIIFPLVCCIISLGIFIFGAMLFFANHQEYARRDADFIELIGLALFWLGGLSTFFTGLILLSQLFS